MPYFNLGKTSLIIGIVAVIVAIWTQYELVVGFASTSGKTRALYGLKQLVYFKYVFIGLIGFIFSIISLRKEGKSKIVFISFSLSIISILLLTLGIWSWFVDI